jgi:hypothetical protein
MVEDLVMEFEKCTNAVNLRVFRLVRRKNTSGSHETV